MKKKLMNSPVVKIILLILLLSVSKSSHAQNRSIIGKVEDANGKPIAGASVVVKGTKTGTTTNDAGTFILDNIKSLKIVLVVSSIGFNEKQVVIGSNSNISIALEENNKAVEEVIVTGVFDKRKKMEASVAISTINARQMAKIVPVSAADLLKNVPGVYVNSSLGEIRNTVYSRGVSVGSNDGASGYYYVSMQEDGLPVTNATFTNYGPDYFLRSDATIGRLEAVRGGTASILGANAPGGIFNYVSREGSSKTSGEIRTKYGLEGNGKNNFYRADFNIGGPLANNWFYNVGGFYRYGEGARYPGYPINNGGQLKANVVKKYASGSLKIYAKYLNDRNGWFEFTPTVGFSNPKPAPGFNENSSVLSPLIRQNFLINGTGKTATYDNSKLIHSIDKSVGLNWEQRLGTGWTFNNALRYSDKSTQWNTNAVVYPFDMSQLISYAILGQLGTPGTFSFRSTRNGQELLSVKSFSGYDFNVINNKLPGNEVAPSSLFFEPLLYMNNGMKELLDQFSLTKKISNMSFTFGGFYGHSRLDRMNGIIGTSLGTIQDKPELVTISRTNEDGTVSLLTNGNGIMGIGSALSLNNASQNQAALFFGHNWQINPTLNLDWGMRYENMRFKGDNQPGVTTQSQNGGLDGNPLTLYDNAVGTTPASFSYDKSLSTFSFSAGLNYKVNSNVSLYGRYSNGKKAPDLDLFLNATTDFLVKTLNPQAQQVRQVEIGIKAKTNNLNLFVTPFYSVLSNVLNVQTFTNADQTFYNPPPLYNKYRTIGVEVETDYSISKHFNIRGVVTLQKSKALDYNVWLSRNLGPADDTIQTYSGNETDNLARSIINITPAYNSDKFYAQLTWAYMGKRQANVANAFLLPAFSQFNFSAGYDVSKYFQLSLSINNLLNKYGVMSWSRPGSFLEALDRQGFTKEMYTEAKASNQPYSTVAIPARAYFITATFKF
jgi:iron complex outermembrane recepter protein